MSCQVFAVEFNGKAVDEDTNEYNDRVDTYKLENDMKNYENIQSVHLVLESCETGSLCFVTVAKSPITNPEKVVMVIYGRGGGKVFHKLISGNSPSELCEYFEYMIGKFANEFDEVFEFFKC
jgi:hypothetical protein